MSDPRRLDRRQLATALREARQMTLDATLDLDDAQWRVPFDPGIQPVAWDLAHIGWFAEFWVLRGPHRIGVDAHVDAEHPARLLPPDDHYDSARISHRQRWQIELYSRAALTERLQQQLDECLHAIANARETDAALYHARFALYHELMHVEALAWTRSLLGHPAPNGITMRDVAPAPPVHIAGGEFRIGHAATAAGFAFDNELPGATARLAPFEIDRHPVTNRQFLQFVGEGGYRRDEFWPGAAGRHLATLQRQHPARWRRREDGEFELRWFDAHIPLPLDQPLVHVSAYEAEAFCRFVGRRLPTAAEWEVAAPHFDWGHSVWEWTADAFAPYPGFRPAPYHTYSAPWFGSQRECRGGAFATHALMHDRRYRNFFAPQRSDVFTGLRTARSL